MENITKKFTRSEVVEIITAQLGVASGEVQDSSRLVEDLGADSLDLCEIIMCFESEMGVDIPTKEISSIKSVGDIINILESRDMWKEID